MVTSRSLAMVLSSQKCIYAEPNVLFAVGIVTNRFSGACGYDLKKNESVIFRSSGVQWQNSKPESKPKPGPKSSISFPHTKASHWNIFLLKPPAFIALSPRNSSWNLASEGFICWCWKFEIGFVSSSKKYMFIGAAEWSCWILGVVPSCDWTNVPN